MKIADSTQKLLMDAAPKDGYVTLTFVRLKFDYDDDGIIEDLVLMIDPKEKRLLNLWYSADCPFAIEGITP
jgi:hypothetical protein